MKSYKITLADTIPPNAVRSIPISLTRQGTIPGIPPGPQTTIRMSMSPINLFDFQSLDIEHEYPFFVSGRTFDTGEPFNKIIAKGDIKAFHSQERGIFLLQGKKSDILDFCKQAQARKAIELRTIRIDMTALQEKLPEIRGVWFRFKSGYIHAKAYMGIQIQDTSEYCDAKIEGDISTLSFYFEDARDGCRHPIMITEDGTVVLQRNYLKLEDEVDFVLHVKNALLDGIFVTQSDPNRALAHVAPEIS